MEKIPDELWKFIGKNIPISTVDYYPIRIRDGQREFLLGKRTNRPCRGKWFTFGGRIHKGETLQKALRRAVKEETGLDPRRLRVKFLGCYTQFNPPNNFGVRMHTIDHLHLIWFRGTIKLSRENSAAQWFNKINPCWPRPLRDMLKMAGFKEAK